MSQAARADGAGAPGCAGAADLSWFPAQVAARVGTLAGSLPAQLAGPVRDLATRPGKGLRPMLVAACAGSGVLRTVRLVRLAAVTELLHLASLLHDDMIDRAVTRRGGPAAHTVVGRELATLSGLACFAQAGSEAAALGDPVTRMVADAAAGLAYGEVLDLERAFDTTLEIPGYLELAERKTGELFKLCCLLGASEAQAGPEAAQALAAFGVRLGVAFQILDDCLDLSPAASGKPGGTDHLLGLFGAPTLLALARDSTGSLAGLLLAPGFSAADMPAVRDLVAAHGGIDAALRLARQQRREAITALDRVPCHEVRTALARIADLACRDLI